MFSDEEQVADPQAVAADNVIRDFRNAHNEALLDKGHPDHNRRVTELKAMFERRYPEPNQFDPSAGAVRPMDDTVDQAAEEALVPVRPEEYEIGRDARENRRWIPNL